MSHARVLRFHSRDHKSHYMWWLRNIYRCTSSPNDTSTHAALPSRPALEKAPALIIKIDPE